MAMFTLPNFDGNNLLIAAAFLLVAVVLGLILTGKLGLWKGEQKWRMGANVGFVALAFIVMFGLKIIGGQLIMLEEDMVKRLPIRKLSIIQAYQP